MLHFPRESYSEAAVARAAAEGYDDVCLGLIERPLAPGVEQGFTLEQGEHIAQWCLKYGLGMVLFTGYMKYQEMLLRDEPWRGFVTAGGSSQIDSDRIAAAWLCPFQPGNLEQYFSAILDPAVRWPAVHEIHLNDEAALGFDSGAIGCHCAHCTEAYRQKTGLLPPKTPRWDDPAWWRWIEYRFDSWTSVHAELRRRLKEIRPEVAVMIQHSPVAPLFASNPWKSAIDLGRDARALDGLATDPYHFMHTYVATYRPHRRLLTEGVRGLAGACLGDRQMSIYTQGFMPPAQSIPMDRQDGLLSGIVPFALGATQVAPFTDELLRIVPGAHGGWMDAKKLIPFLQRVRPAPFVTVIAPLRSEIYGRPQSNWGAAYLHELTEVMYRVGLPWRWFCDSRLDDAADQLRGPLIVPEAHCLTSSQARAIQAVADRGEGVLWIGNTAGRGCDASGLSPPPVMPESGPWKVDLFGSESRLFQNLPGPVFLQSRVSDAKRLDEIIACVENQAALTRSKSGRQAWVAGLPSYDTVVPGVHGSIRQPEGGIELLRRLLLDLTPSRPIAWLDPFPPVNDYARLRPWDRRGIFHAELFPLSGAKDILAILFPYVEGGFEATLRFSPPPNCQIDAITEIWSGREYQFDGPNACRIIFPADCELMAFHAPLRTST
jgi:hypothetical protein